MYVIITTISTILILFASAVNQFCIVEELLAKTPTIRCGAEGLVGITKQRFMDRLTWLKCLLRFNISNWYDRKNFERVSYTLESLRLDDSNGSIRKQPYCVLLTGYPGCGKSTYALKLAMACLKSRYGYAHSNDIVTLNETDEFQSEYRSSHKVVVFDDLGAEKIRNNTVNPWRKIIDFVNNIRKTSLNPNVEMKGNVYIGPDLVIITTNLGENYNIANFMNAPSAIYRRLKYMVYLQQGYETAKIYKMVRGSHLITKVFTYSEGPIIDNEILDLDNLMKKITADFNQHMEQQEKFVHKTNLGFDKVESKTAFKSFYDDVVLPILPVKIPLTKYIESQLPFYVRWYRFFCVEDTRIPVCMSGGSAPVEFMDEDSSFDDSTDDDETSSTLSNRHVYDRNDLIDFIIARVDWSFYRVIRKDLNSVGPIRLFADRIFANYRCYTWYYPALAYHECEADGIRCTLEDLDCAYEKYKSLSFEMTPQGSAPRIQDSSLIRSDTTTISFTRMAEKFENMIERSIFPDTWLNNYVFNTFRLPDPNVTQVMDTSPIDFDLVAYEMPIKKGVVDLMFRYKGETRTFYIIVEVKSKKTLAKALEQVKGYKSILKQEAPIATTLLTIAFNNRNVDWDFPTFNEERDIIVSKLQKWKNQYLDRCGAVEPKNREPLSGFSDYNMNDSDSGTMCPRSNDNICNRHPIFELSTNSPRGIS